MVAEAFILSHVHCYYY